MKKIIIGIGSALGVLLAAALVIFIFFPGLPTYFKIKKDCLHIDDTLPEFSKVEIPEDYKRCTIKGLSFKLPEGAEQPEMSTIRYTYGDELSVGVLESDSYQNEQILKDYDEEYSKWKEYKYDEKKYRHFFRTIGDNYPDPAVAEYDLLWFLKDRLSSKTCLKLRGDDMDVFREFADCKEEAYSFENSYHMDGDGFTAYVSEDLSGMLKDGIWTVTLYPDGGGSKYYFVMVTGDNYDMKMQAISSIKLTEGK